MSEFNIQSESIDVEQIMQQVRSRIRDKRGQDYTEAEIRKLANVKLERFLNPHDVRSDLVKHYRQRQNQPAGRESRDVRSSSFRLDPSRAPFLLETACAGTESKTADGRQPMKSARGWRGWSVSWESLVLCGCG